MFLNFVCPIDDCFHLAPAAAIHSTYEGTRHYRHGHSPRISFMLFRLSAAPIPIDTRMNPNFLQGNSYPTGLGL